jgi:hypothetical protein
MNGQIRRDANWHLVSRLSWEDRIRSGRLMALSELDARPLLVWPTFVVLQSGRLRWRMRRRPSQLSSRQSMQGGRERSHRYQRLRKRRKMPANDNQRIYLSSGSPAPPAHLLATAQRCQRRGRCLDVERAQAPGSSVTFGGPAHGNTISLQSLDRDLISFSAFSQNSRSRPEGRPASSQSS